MIAQINFHISGTLKDSPWHSYYLIAKELLGKHDISYVAVLGSQWIDTI